MITRKSKLQCQQLEDRTNPGTITASFSRGSLLLTGSVDDDVLTISQPSAGVIQVVGDNATPIRMGPKGQITPAGTPVSFGTAAAPVKNLTAKMGLGTDEVVIDLGTKAINLAGNVRIDMGAGGTTAKNQRIEVLDNGSASAPNFLSVGKNFTARGGSGVDFYLLSEIATVGNFRVTDTGGDTSEIFVGSNPVLSPGDPLVPVGGSITIRTGAGAEGFVGLIGLDVKDRTSISTGTGSLTTPENAFVEFGFGSGQTTFFHGGLRIRSAPRNTGIDVISFDKNSAVTIGGPGLSINSYGGNDNISLNDLINTGRTSISTGLGDDEISFDSPTKTSTFTGSVSVKTGDGKDKLNVGSTTQVKFLSSVSANLGKDDDTLMIDNGSTFDGLFNADLGAGNDTVSIAQSLTAIAPVKFTGKATIKTGADNDTLILGLGTGGNANSKVVFEGAGSKIDGGKGANSFDDGALMQFSGLTFGTSILKFTDPNP